MRAVKAAVKEKHLQDLSEEDLETYFDTAGTPDPDIVIRTSGEKRISNFLLWQAAYSEFVFTDVLWPDFSRADLEAAIEEYRHRNRRYGGLDTDTAEVA